MLLLETMESSVNKSSIIAPAHWNYDVVDFIEKSNIDHSDDFQISELYGALPGEIIKHGRSDSAVESISREDSVKFRNYLKEKGLGFIYLLNAPFNFSNDKAQQFKVEEYLDWIVNEMNADAVTISSHELARFVRSRYESLKIYVSTIAAIQSVEEYERWQDVNPSRVVLHHDQNRNWKNLELLLKHSESAEAEIELMLNESCLRGCIQRDAHYASLGTNGDGIDAPFLSNCNSKRIYYPHEYIRSNFIRPEDVKLYEEMGVKRFKITGRSKPAKWLPEVVKAYQDRFYEGNMVRLMGSDPKIKAEDSVYINNKSLDGFLMNFDNDRENEYSKRWIKKMYENGDFKMLDGTEYEVNNGNLIIKKMGKFALERIGNDKNR